MNMTSVEEGKEQRPNPYGQSLPGILPSSPLLPAGLDINPLFSSVELPHLYIQQPCRNLEEQKTFCRDSLNISGLRPCQSNFISGYFFHVYTKQFLYAPTCLSVACCGLVGCSWVKWGNRDVIQKIDLPAGWAPTTVNAFPIWSGNNSVTCLPHVSCSGLWGEQRKIPARGFDIVLENIRAKWRNTCCLWLTCLVVMDFSVLLLRLKIFLSWSRENNLVPELVLNVFILLVLVIVFPFQRSLYHDPSKDKVPNIYKRKVEIEKSFSFWHRVAKY